MPEAGEALDAAQYSGVPFCMVGRNFAWLIRDRRLAQNDERRGDVDRVAHRAIGPSRDHAYSAAPAAMTEIISHAAELPVRPLRLLKRRGRDRRAP